MREPPRRILGIDPGPHVTGYGCIAVDGNREPVYVECGVLDAPEGWGLYGRLGELLKGLDALLDDLRPDSVALEAGYVPDDPGRAADALLVAAARGVCGAAAARRGLSISEYQPATVKKCACGSGKAKKEQVAAIVVVRLKMAKQPDLNAADALAVALTHYQMATGTARRAKS